MSSISIGSQTAKNGFLNEDDIVIKFNNWKKDKEAKDWLTIMEYKLSEIEYVEAEKLHGYKTDVQVRVTIKLKSVIDAQNLQVKLVSSKKGFNQIDKRWIDNYKILWNIPENIVSILKRYCGEEKPSIKKLRDKRRMFINEFTDKEQSLLRSWLTAKQTLIVGDVLKGRGQFAAEWMLIAQKKAENARWILKPMNYCLNFFGNGTIEFTNKGNVRIGKIGMQRKGGDGGKSTACMLQFKIDPTLLFDDPF